MFRKFSEGWSWLKIMYELADSKIEKIGEIYQKNLLDVFQFLTYLCDKAEADEAEDKFQEQMRKAKRGR